MRPSPLFRVWIGLCACMSLAGCPASTKHDGDMHTVGSGLLAACDEDAECASKLCTYGLYSVNEPGVCSKSCASNADCKDSMGEHATCREVAAIPNVDGREKGSTWRKACVLACAESDPGVFECKDGVRLFCQDDAPVACSVCGCPEGSHCSAHDDQCKTYARAGVACKDDVECLSGHCQNSKCTSGQGDVCDESCDGTCGGPADALYCMPKCMDKQCPVHLHGWECFGASDDKDDAYCGRVCNDAKDCVGGGDVCEKFPDSDEDSWQYYFTGFCHQPR